MSSAEDMLGWSGGELRSAAGSLGCGDMAERIAPTLPVWKGASHRQAVGTGSASCVYVLRSILQRRRGRSREVGAAWAISPGCLIRQFLRLV